MTTHHGTASPAGSGRPGARPSDATEQRCELTELYKSACAHCRGITNLPELPPKWSGPQTFIEAAYIGACTSCHGPIFPGDQIRSNGNGGWLCIDCGQE